MLKRKILFFFIVALTFLLTLSLNPKNKVLAQYGGVDGDPDDIKVTVETSTDTDRQALPMTHISNTKFDDMHPNGENVVHIKPDDSNFESEHPDVFYIQVNIHNWDIQPDVDISGVTWTSPPSTYAQDTTLQLGQNMGFIVPCSGPGTLSVHIIFNNGITADLSGQISCSNPVDSFNAELGDPRQLFTHIWNDNIQPYFLLTGVNYYDTPLPYFHEVVSGPSSYLYVNDQHSVTIPCDKINFPNPNTLGVTYMMGGTEHVHNTSNHLCGATVNIHFSSTMFPTPTSVPTSTPTPTVPPHCVSPQSVQTNCGPNGDGWQSCYFSWDGQSCHRGSCILPCWY